MLLKRIYLDSAAAALFGVAILMLLALQSYSNTDLLLSGALVANFLGRVGAYFADSVFFIMGYSGYALVALLFFYSLTLFLQPQGESKAGGRLPRAANLPGLLLSCLAFSVLLELHLDSNSLPQGPGGLIGLHGARYAYEYLGFSGATSTMLLLEMLGLSLLVGLSWYDLCERIGYYASWPLRAWAANQQRAERELRPKYRVVQPTRSRAEIEELRQRQMANDNYRSGLITAERALEPRPEPEVVEPLAEVTPVVQPVDTDSANGLQASAANEYYAGAFGLDANQPLRRAFAQDAPAAAPAANAPPLFLQQRGGAWGQDWDQQAPGANEPSPQPAELESEPDADAAKLASAAVASATDGASMSSPASEAAANEAEVSAEEPKSAFQALSFDFSAKPTPPADPAPIPAPNSQTGAVAANLAASAPQTPPPALVTAPPARGQSFSLPSLDLLSNASQSVASRGSEYELNYLGHSLEQRLGEYGIEAKVVAANPGPVVTRFELDLAAGVKVARVVNIAKDLARSLAVSSVRVVEIIPGKSHIGVEVPNKNRRIVRLREVLATGSYQGSKDNLALALGVDIEGKPVISNLARMPHLLVAGTTGSGKSVGVNAMLLSLLYKASPEQVRLILIDPKMLELSVYNDIPHLLTEVIVDMNNAARGLRWCVMEMERRYQLMSKLGVRNLEGFNAKLQQSPQPILDPLWDERKAAPGERPEQLKALPQIVVVVDEYADLMMTVGKKVEELIARIAQKARAAGIHLILATQRPSVDVITGLIKANIPARIGYQVSSKIDSRTILDQGGAEQLLGHGDMLFLSGGTALPVRVHGAFVSDAEVHRVAEFWRGQKLASGSYMDKPLNFDSDEELEAREEVGSAAEPDPESDEPLYDAAVEFVINTRKVSISSVQRKFKIGYNRAARIIETMEDNGLVSAMETNGKRDVLVPEPA